MQFVSQRHLHDLRRPGGQHGRRPAGGGHAGQAHLACPTPAILLHQPFGGTQGQASDIAIQAKEILRIRENLYHILVKHTRQPKTKIQADIERDFIMTAAQAKEYGLIDQIFTTRSAAKK